MAPELVIPGIKFEHHPTGLGVSTATPRLSWTVNPKGSEVARNWIQTSYEVQVKRSSTEEPKTFTFDKSDTVLVPWPDSPLVSSETASVRVRSLGSCDDGKCDTDWSQWTGVEASLLKQGDWTAKTIVPPTRTDTRHPDENGTRPYRFRKTFTFPEGIVRTRLYITALGVYEVYLNGRRVGDECLAPGWTAYQHRIQFQTFDVGSLITPGTNTIVVEVAEGWYTGRLLWGDGIRNVYGKDIGVLAQLQVFSAEGSTTPSQTVCTDESWECAPSPIVASGIYDGETLDLGLDYDFTGSAQAPWTSVKVIDSLESTLVASSFPAIRVTQSIKPVVITKDPDGKTLIDFGQNLVGRVRIPSLSRPDGHRVVLRFAEVLEHGRLGTRPLRHAKATDSIIFSGGRALKDWYPHYTYHGFRYVEVTGWSADDSDPLTSESLFAEVMHSDLVRTGQFSCSDERLNRLHENVVWSMRGNFVGIPTDCPQRDERLGWTGDIQVFSPTASYIYDCCGFLTNWMRDVVAETLDKGGVVPLVVPNAMKDGPWPAVPQAIWDDVIVLVPWTLYLQFGDIEVLKQSWDGMKAYLRAIRRDDDGLWDPTLWQLGDWLDPNAPPSDPGLARTDGTLVADEYLVHVTSTMIKIAEILGIPQDLQYFKDEHAKLSQAFRDKYITKSGLVVGDSQTSLALSLVFNLHSNESQRSVAAARLARLVRYAKFQVSTGFAGTPVVLHALTQGGYQQVAYRMLLEDSCPSWLYPVRMGATTIWERWDSMLEDGSINPGEMTSFNHYALGSVANWMHTNIGGISPLEPGWKKFLVKPSPGGTITNSRASFKSSNGDISCHWNLEADTLKGEVTVPPNVRAVIEGPNGRVEVGSGKHVLEWKMDRSEPWPPKPLLTQFTDDQ